MNKFIVAITFAFSTFLIFGGVSTATADDRCNDRNVDACEIYLQQQTAPAYTGPKAEGGPVRCVWVVANEPSALMLREGSGTNGAPIISWRKASLQWVSGRVNGARVKMTQICFSQSLLYGYEAVTLCGEIGHSKWRNANMAYVREHNIPKTDPACVGGTGWCEFRGL